VTDPIVEVRDLRKLFPIRGGVLRKVQREVKAVDGVSFTLSEGETLGLVGESGCGKSTTGRLVTGLWQPTSGEIRIRGVDATTADAARRRSAARDVQIVFQDPDSSLSPRMLVRDIVAEPLRIQGLYADGGAERVRSVLASVGLTDQHAGRYAHEFSGGQRQRIGIARALVLGPSVVVLDEPVSALDVSIQAQVVNELKALQVSLGLAYLFISHDLSLVRHTCDRVAVMYLGKIVEEASRSDLFTGPRHPYTQALLSAIPSAEVGDRRERIVLRGDVPSPVDPPSGCRFRTRCWKAQEVCASTEPPLLDVGEGHRVACHFPQAVDILAGEPVGAGARS
jgi:oligopeptide/dipeptide ABC transporter ATP-binding protein